MGSDQLVKAAYSAVGALVVGAIGPWATAFGFDKAGTEGDGVLTLTGAVVALLLLTWLKRPTLALVVSFGIAVIAIYDFIDISGTEFVSVGWGLYLSLVGVALMLYVCIRMRGLDSGDVGSR